MKINLFLLWFFVYSMSMFATDADPYENDYFQHVMESIRSEERYQNLSLIGSGNFGLVFHDKTHAVKISPLDYSGRRLNNILESAVLKSLFHPAIPTPVNIHIHRGQTHKFLELHMPRYKVIEAVNKQEILKKMASLLGYLHKINIVHRDVKPPHILLGNDGYKLIDWGSVDIFAADPIRQINGTSIPFRSPELLLGENDFPKENDMWSLGLSLLELIANKPIFSGNEETVLGQLLRPITIPSDSDEEFEFIPFNERQLSLSLQKEIVKNIRSDDILHRLFHVNPKERISADTLNKYLGNKEKWPSLLEVPPKTSFINNSRDYVLRYELFLWMYDLSYRFQFPPKIIFEAMSIADQFFCTSVISEKNALAMGAIAFYLASGFYYQNISIEFLISEAGFKNVHFFDFFLFRLLENAHFKLIFNHSLRQFQDDLYYKFSPKDRDMIITLLLLLEIEEVTFKDSNEIKWKIATIIFRDKPDQKCLDYVRILCQRFQNTPLAETMSFKAILKKIPARRNSRTLELPKPKESCF